MPRSRSENTDIGRYGEVDKVDALEGTLIRLNGNVDPVDVCEESTVDISYIFRVGFAFEVHKL